MVSRISVSFLFFFKWIKKKASSKRVADIINMKILVRNIEYRPVLI